MKKIAFLGGGKIGRAMMAHAAGRKNVKAAFVYDPYLKMGEISGVPVVSELDRSMFEGLDLVIECATAEVIAQYLDDILSCCSLLVFSMTAFHDDDLRERAEKICEAHGTHVYLPHGAILGLDGIFDGRDEVTEVTIETTKNPKSLGRDNTECEILYEGTTKEAASCSRKMSMSMPRLHWRASVLNVHIPKSYRIPQWTRTRM